MAASAPHAPKVKRSDALARADRRAAVHCRLLCSPGLANAPRNFTRGIGAHRAPPVDDVGRAARCAGLRARVKIRRAPYQKPHRAPAAPALPDHRLMGARFCYSETNDFGIVLSLYAA